MAELARKMPESAHMTGFSSPPGVECVHVCLQRTGSHSSIQGDGQVGGIPGETFLTIVLIRGAA